MGGKVSGENLFPDYSGPGRARGGGYIPPGEGQIVLLRGIETPGAAIPSREIYDVRIDSFGNARAWIRRSGHARRIFTPDVSISRNRHSGDVMTVIREKKHEGERERERDTATVQLLMKTSRPATIMILINITAFLEFQIAHHDFGLLSVAGRIRLALSAQGLTPARQG